MDHKVNGQGHLVLGGADAVALAEKYGTPLYVMEEDVIRAAMRAYRQSVERFYDGKGLICYASKAFACKEMYRIAKAEGLGADVVSGGELYTAGKAGFPMEKVVFHGNNKTPEELRMALDLGVGRIVVDNFEELEALSALAAENGVRPNIQLRIKPGIDAHTHKFIMTGQIDSKFGFALETGEAMEAVKQALACPSLNFTGVHCHIGSQIHEVTPFIRAAEVMVQFMADVRQETGHTLGELNLGGGYGIRYTDEDDPVPYAAYMEEVSEAIRASAAALQFPVPFKGKMQPADHFQLAFGRVGGLLLVFRLLGKLAHHQFRHRGLVFDDVGAAFFGGAGHLLGHRQVAVVVDAGFGNNGNRHGGAPLFFFVFSCFTGGTSLVVDISFFNTNIL